MNNENQPVEEQAVAGQGAEEAAPAPSEAPVEAPAEPSEEAPAEPAA